ncbi:MAG: hypothetical protein WAV18_15940, partial [Roseiarcus sp.]
MNVLTKGGERRLLSSTRKSNWKFHLTLAMLLALFAPRAASAEEACVVAPSIPTHLMDADSVGEYRSLLRVCRAHDGRQSVAIREMSLAGQPVLLLADAQSLRTRLERASCWTCKDAADDELSGTRFMRAIEASAAAPGLEHRGFLENAGLTHGGSSGAYLTGDLCPSKRPLDRAFLDELATQEERPPIALSISGLWLLYHFADYQWLLRKQAEGAFDITWVDHSYHHQFRRGVPNDRNFMLAPGVDADAEILDTEKLLIANGQTPSLFFRFPGLISSAPLMQAARRHHLIALGANAWLAIGQHPRPGSIVLVHPNGNEEIGLKMFDRDLARGTIEPPLEPLEAAPD